VVEERELALFAPALRREEASRKSQFKDLNTIEGFLLSGSLMSR